MYSFAAAKTTCRACVMLQDGKDSAGRELNPRPSSYKDAALTTKLPADAAGARPALTQRREYSSRADCGGKGCARGPAAGRGRNEHAPWQARCHRREIIPGRPAYSAATRSCTALRWLSRTVAWRHASTTRRGERMFARIRRHAPRRAVQFFYHGATEKEEPWVAPASQDGGVTPPHTHWEWVLQKTQARRLRHRRSNSAATDKTGHPWVAPAGPAA